MAKLTDSVCFICGGPGGYVKGAVKPGLVQFGIELKAPDSEHVHGTCLTKTQAEIRGRFAKHDKKP